MDQKMDQKSTLYALMSKFLYSELEDKRVKDNEEKNSTSQRMSSNPGSGSGPSGAVSPDIADMISTLAALTGNKNNTVSSNNFSIGSSNNFNSNSKNNLSSQAKSFEQTNENLANQANCNNLANQAQNNLKVIEDKMLGLHLVLENLIGAEVTKINQNFHDLAQNMSDFQCNMVEKFDRQTIENARLMTEIKQFKQEPAVKTVIIEGSVPQNKMEPDPEEHVVPVAFRDLPKSAIDAKLQPKQKLKPNKNPKKAANNGKFSNPNPNGANGKAANVVGSPEFAHVRNNGYTDSTPAPPPEVQKKPVPHLVVHDDPEENYIEYKETPWSQVSRQKKNFATAAHQQKNIQKKANLDTKRSRTELLAFGIPHSKSAGSILYKREEIAKFLEAISEGSTTHLGPEFGYNVDPKKDIKGGGRIVTWKGTEECKPVKIIFTNANTVDKIKAAARKGGFLNRRTRSKFGKFKLTGDETTDRIQEISLPDFYVQESTTKRMRDEFRERKIEAATEEGIRRRQIYEHQKKHRWSLSGADFDFDWEQYYAPKKNTEMNVSTATGGKVEVAIVVKKADRVDKIDKVDNVDQMSELQNWNLNLSSSLSLNDEANANNDTIIEIADDEQDESRESDGDAENEVKDTETKTKATTPEGYAKCESGVFVKTGPVTSPCKSECGQLNETLLSTREINSRIAAAAAADTAAYNATLKVNIPPLNQSKIATAASLAATTAENSTDAAKKSEKPLVELADKYLQLKKQQGLVDIVKQNLKVWFEQTEATQIEKNICVNKLMQNKGVELTRKLYDSWLDEIRNPFSGESGILRVSGIPRTPPHPSKNLIVHASTPRLPSINPTNHV